MQVVSLGLTAAAMWWAVRMLKKAQNPVTAHQRALKKLLCEELGIPQHLLNLDEHEFAHLSKVMLPQNIAVTLQDVAGTDSILEQLRRDIAFSCSVRPTSATSMLAGSKGLLLYGPPGTGKTMIASVRCFPDPLRADYVVLSPDMCTAAVLEVLTSTLCPCRRLLAKLEQYL